MSHEQEYVRALGHLTDTYLVLGCSRQDADQRAQEFMHRLVSAGWRCNGPTVPVEPYTGDKAEEQTPAYLAERARLRAARGATTTDTEEQA